jgi:hypothetical protein
LRAIARTLVLAIFIGGLPILSGVTIAADGAPAFTLDICHPQQSPAQLSLPDFVPPARPFTIAAAGRDFGTCERAPQRLNSRLHDSIDPDPPEVSS